MKKHSVRRISIDVNRGAAGFQIAPMIDVVFVIMLFFMVMAGAVKRENELNTTLPGDAETTAATDFADEQIIAISEEGEVTLNDEPMDDKNSAALPQLTATLRRLKQTSDNAKATLSITIASEEQTKYRRAVDVLNACAAAKIENVTFTVGGDD